MVPGAKFPDFQLPDYTGETHRLSELQRGNPMCLMLARGGYCPKAHQQHLQLVKLEPEIKVAYSEIVTISTDNALETMEWIGRLGASWTFLSDTERIVQRDLEIDEYTDSMHRPMIPHTVMLEPGLVVHSIYMGYWYWGRPTPEEIRQDFRAITRKCRPDWDLNAPGLREKWAEDNKETFWPYS
ncbi:MAG TPA: redoxin domain-containing protein [Actinobacteria bacterium]|nr:redoxin domain-containing protein [Actinomycetota bacterium]